MMQISASDVAKFKAALAKYQNAQKEERIRIETMKREEQARIEHERQEKQRQDEERNRQINDTMAGVVGFAVIAGIIALIYYGWESILEIIGYIIGYIIVIAIVIQIGIVIWPILVFLLGIGVVGVAFVILRVILEEGCGG